MKIGKKLFILYNCFTYILFASSYNYFVRQNFKKSIKKQVNKILYLKKWEKFCHESIAFSTLRYRILELMFFFIHIFFF